MPKARNADRKNTTSRGSGYVAIRLTPNEAQALAALVELAQVAIDATGLPVRASQSSVLRAALKKEALEHGVWPKEKASKADPRQLVIPGADGKKARAPLRKRHQSVLDAVQANLQKNLGMAMVPDVVRALGGDVVVAHQALLEACRAGVIELRPESGLGRLTKSEKSLCVPGLDGALLSVIRVIA